MCFKFLNPTSSFDFKKRNNPKDHELNIYILTFYFINMKKFLSISVFVSVMALAGSAQIHVLQSGHVVIGEKEVTSAGGLILNTDALNPDTSCAMTIDGPNYRHTGGMISFGNTQGVRIGEEADDVLTLLKH